MITTFLINYLNHKNSTKIRNDMLTSMASILQFSSKDKATVCFILSVAGIGSRRE